MEVKGTPYHVRGVVPGAGGALCNKKKHMQGTSAKYIMWRLRVTAAADEVSGRWVEYIDGVTGSFVPPFG